MNTNKYSWLSATCYLVIAACLPFLCSCTVKTGGFKDSSYSMEVSVPQQKMAVYNQGKMVKTYSVSTSKFGIGDQKGSYKTPLGKFEVAEKIGTGKPFGAVFKSRKWTGEVIKPNAPGRDPIVSRILWLHGLEPKNKNAYSRCIYIHGTAAEKDIGKKSSYGCIRMKSRDIIELYDNVAWGSPVEIVNRKLWSGIDNPETQLNEDLTIPIAAQSPGDIFRNQDDNKPLWSELTPDQAAREILDREGFEVSYFTIEPIY
ncbi:MAG: L,D-transpeptidase [Verrucomicrobiales bacterium]|nr:L,D-transpeptidase [Verrucomicrobiales bacterium]